MTPDEIHVQLDELDTRVDRLRATYEQYFTGIERLEPHVQRKDVERRFQALRRVQMRNTALRFRFQTLVQKYTAYMTYWQRICRQIEEGTYRRDLVRAQRYGQGIARQAADDEEAVYELDISDVESDDDPVEPVGAVGAVGAVDRGAAAPRPDAVAARPRFEPAPVYQASRMVEEIPLGVYGVPPSIVPPPPAAVPAPTPPRASPAVGGLSHANPARPAPAPPAPPRAVPGAPAPPLPAAPAPAGGASAPGARRAFSSPFGAPRAGAPTVPPPAPSAPPAAPPAAMPVKPPPARPAAPPEASSAADPAMRALYERYRDARRRNGEGEVSFDQVARQVRETMPRLAEKYRDQDVTLDVSEKDGKTVLRPVVKPRRP